MQRMQITLNTTTCSDLLGELLAKHILQSPAVPHAPTKCVANGPSLLLPTSQDRSTDPATSFIFSDCRGDEPEIASSVGTGRSEAAG